MSTFKELLDKADNRVAHGMTALEIRAIMDARGELVARCSPETMKLVLEALENAQLRCHSERPQARIAGVDEALAALNRPTK